MAVDHVKSTAITNLDAPFATVPGPIFISTSAEGAFGMMRRATGYATAVASSSVGATYQLVRVPSNAKIQSIDFESAAQGAGKFSLGVYYATDGSNASSVTGGLLLAATINATFFASQIDCSSAVAITNETNQSGNYTIDLRTKPLWLALALATDPGGNLDIVATVDTTAVTTGTGKFGIAVTYAI
jgi:hypothetical protein